ncbi:MAG: HupE/UreJ family protein [Myxococcota bacterium]|nr:HupE/UreJ family protein [Myxococcota bacterium]
MQNGLKHKSASVFSRTASWASTPTLLLLNVLLLASVSQAHPLAPALLELTAEESGITSVLWKVSRLRPRGQELRPELPVDCPPIGPVEESGDAQSVSLAWTVDCGPAGIVGQRVGLASNGPIQIDVLLRISLPDGRVVRDVLRKGHPSIQVPAKQTKLQVGWGYLILGFEHILGGTDHLMFVLGLMLLVIGIRPLVKTITAFTLGHSVTLSLATLGITQVPSALAEFLIAATLLALAVELATPTGDRPALIQRHPWLMACAFGLVHGLGFAGALSEVGLPQQEIPLALLAFNIGIETGQLLFVSGMAIIVVVASRPLRNLPAWTQQIPAYAIGSCAAFWCLERLADLF